MGIFGKASQRTAKTYAISTQLFIDMLALRIWQTSERELINRAAHNDPTLTNDDKETLKRLMARTNLNKNSYAVKVK